MISPKLTGAIITAIVIVIGIALLYPALHLDKLNEKNMVLLTFNIINSTNMPSWCNDLSKFLQENNIHSTMFITGKMADTYPNCVTAFSKENDIGSMTYSYDTITSIPTRTDQLNHIKEGKAAVDKQGKLNSTIFKAPRGIVDENIYSMLTQSHILADFSYNDHYNVYTDGLSGKIFYRFPMTSLDSISDSKLPVRDENVPMTVNFYNYDSVKNIQEFINLISKEPHRFVTASELTKMDLTIR
jgi:peptidoglycan/xylan/chitin deacetylase (PgdA/CDA1 family)